MGKTSELLHKSIFRVVPCIRDAVEISGAENSAVRCSKYISAEYDSDKSVPEGPMRKSKKKNEKTGTALMQDRERRPNSDSSTKPKAKATARGIAIKPRRNLPSRAYGERTSPTVHGLHCHG